MTSTINHIDVTSGQDEIEINEAHIQNPNYKGKNYDPNYQQNKNKKNFNNNSTSGTNYQSNGNQGQGNHYTRNNHQEKPVNVCHVERTCQQETAVQDTRSTETSITVPG